MRIMRDDNDGPALAVKFAEHLDDFSAGIAVQAAGGLIRDD